MIDFGHAYISRYQNGDRLPVLKPGQISVHDGDMTTYIYDLSGLGKGAGRKFEEWWLSIDSEIYERSDEQGCSYGFNEPTFRYAGQTAMERKERRSNKEICDGCTDHGDFFHRCKADATLCIDGKDCPDFVEHCSCKQCEQRFCCICGELNDGPFSMDHNAHPVIIGRCCGVCNETIVIPARLKQFTEQNRGN